MVESYGNIMLLMFCTTFCCWNTTLKIILLVWTTHVFHQCSALQ